MPDLETLTAQDVQSLVSVSALRVARARLGLVQDPVRNGQFLSAQVRDTHQYTVHLQVDATALRARCGCGTGGGFCWHSTAVLLKWVQDPSSFAVDTEVVLNDGYPLPVSPVQPPTVRRPDTGPAWVPASVARRQEQDRKQLEGWLGHISLSDLRAMARQRGWKLKGNRKDDIVRQVIPFMVDPAGIRRAIAGLDAEHRQVLQALAVLDIDGLLPPEGLEPVARLWGPLKSYKQMTTYTRHLWQAGLALPGAVRAGAHGDYDFVPAAMRRHFPALLDGVVTAAANLPPGAPATGLRLADPLALVRAAAQIAVLLEQSPIPLRPPRPRPYLERFYPELGGWDYDLDELAAADRKGQFRQREEMALTVLPPGHFLPDEAVERLGPIAGGGTTARGGGPRFREDDASGGTTAGGEAKLDFIYALLVELGLLLPGSPTTVWPEVKVEFLRQDELAQRALLARAYLQLKNWSELWDVLRTTPDLKVKHDRRYSYVKVDHLLAALFRCRHLVLRALAWLPDGRWVTMADLAPLLQAVWPRFDYTLWQDDWRPATMRAWFLSHDGQPLQAGNDADWDLAQGNFIRRVISGPLHWLGFADLDMDGDRLFAFRLHGLADLYWDRVEVPPLPAHAAEQIAEAAPAAAVTTDDLTIRVTPSAVSAQAHSLLDKIARLDVVESDCFVYRLDVQATFESFERGAVLSDIMADWAELLPVPMSEAICSRLEAWWQSYGLVRVYENLAVVELGDDYVLAEMKAVTSLAQYLVAEISPRLVIIRPEGIGPLVDQLERAGYTPRQVEGV